MAEPAPTDSRERPSAVIAMGLGFMVILIAVASLLSSGTGDLDPGTGLQTLEDRFDQIGELPFGFEVTSARQISRGALLVILSDPAGPVPEPGLPPMTDSERPAPPKPSKDKGKGGHGMDFVDWTGLPEGQAGTPPVELAFAWYPREKAEKVLAAQFARVHFRDLRRLSREGDAVTVDSGQVDWGVYDADYVRTRHFKLEDDWSTEDGQPGGEERRVFHDQMRVNLSLGSECCVLYLRWPRGLPGSKQRLEEALAAFRPRPQTVLPDGP